MSYTIVYDRQFIKLSDGRIIPMILCGSNNCWETDNNGNCTRRERYWTPYWDCNIVPAFTPDELLKKAEGQIGGEYTEHFKRAGKWVDDAGLLRFFRNGIKQAKTIEELADEGINSAAIRAFLSVWTKVPGKSEWDAKRTSECVSYLNSDEDVIAFLAEAEKRLQNRTETETIHVCLKYYGTEPLPKPKRESKPKERLAGDFYVVTFGCGNYVTKINRSVLYHCPYIGSAKQFKTADEAEKWIKQQNLATKIRGELKVEKIA